MSSRNIQLQIRFPQPVRQLGELVDPSLVRVGRRFRTNWAFVSDNPTQYVYQVIDSDGEVRYVGVTNWFSARWSAHLQSSRWASTGDIYCVILSGYRTRFDARVAEALLIDEHRPDWNTKPERKYLRIGRRVGMPRDVLTAELVPVEPKGSRGLAED